MVLSVRHVLPLALWLMFAAAASAQTSTIAGEFTAEPPTLVSLGFDWRINEGPQRFIAQAALRGLDRWVSAGTPPAQAARIELASERPPVIARDACGIALGGVRTPMVDVPAVTLSGEPPPGSSGHGWLVGSTAPLDSATLLRRYHDQAGYLADYARSLDAAIDGGFLLPEHREELLAAAATVTFAS